MFDADEVLRAAEITSLPPGADKSALAKQILNDHLVTARALELAVEHFGAEALRRAHALEKASLRKRFGLEAKPDKPRVEWTCGQHTISGQTCITAKCGPETVYWAGPVEDLPRFKFRGESIPGDIAELYRMTVGSCASGDPSRLQAEHDYNARLEAEKKQMMGPHKWVGRS